MASTNQRSSRGNTEEEDLPWVDYQPPPRFQRQWIPDHVTCLRIGVAEQEQGDIVIELPGRLCKNHPNLQRLQIHVSAVARIPIDIFLRCRNLKLVEFVATTGRPSRLVSIDDAAFAYCDVLHSVIGMEHVAHSLKRIGLIAFHCCKSLRNLDLSHLTALHHVGGLAFSECRVTEIDLSNAGRLQELHASFLSCKTATTVCLPPALRRIDAYCFSHCRAMTSIKIPPSVSHISGPTLSRSMTETEVFENCVSLTTVTYQSTRYLRQLLTSPQFQGCDSLHTLEWPGRTPRALWPNLLEQFLREEGGLLRRAGIRHAKNRNSIVFNFLRHNIAEYFLASKQTQWWRGRMTATIADPANSTSDDVFRQRKLYGENAGRTMAE